jgi:hypothetical protein
MGGLVALMSRALFLQPSTGSDSLPLSLLLSDDSTASLSSCSSSALYLCGLSMPAVVDSGLLGAFVVFCPAGRAHSCAFASSSKVVGVKVVTATDGNAMVARDMG